MCICRVSVNLQATKGDRDWEGDRERQRDNEEENQITKYKGYKLMYFFNSILVSFMIYYVINWVDIVYIECLVK